MGGEQTHSQPSVYLELVCYSLFVLLLFVFRILFFAFRFSHFVFRILFFAFRYDIRNPILAFKLKANTFKILFFTFESGLNIVLTFEMRPNIAFGHSKFYLDIQIGTEFRTLTFEWGQNIAF